MNTMSLVWGASFIYMLHRVGDKTKPCGTPAFISLGVDILTSTKALNLRFERKEPMSFIKLVENSNLDNLYTKPENRVVGITGLFNVREHHGHRHFIVDIKGHVVL
jgi:hypothetical protein